MTFTEFSRIVKAKYPEAELFKHGEMAGNKINVAVIFNPDGKVYQYNGTYCEVLNKLKIKAVYKHNYENVISTLNRYIADNGKECEFFGGINNYDDDIERLTKIVKDYKENYIIV